MLLTSRTTVAGALVLGAVVALRVPAAAAPTVEDASGRTKILVSISAPESVPGGEDATFGVTVRDIDTKGPVAGNLVVLMRRAAGEGGWAEVARTVTDERGRAILTAAVKPPATDFKARVPRTDDRRAGRSARVTVTVE